MWLTKNNQILLNQFRLALSYLKTLRFPKNQMPAVKHKEMAKNVKSRNGSKKLELMNYY